MNFDLDLYEKTDAKEFGDYTPLALGGHILKIVDAKEYTSEISGKTSLKVDVDIADGDEQANYFKDQYDNNDNADKKWPNGGTKYLSLANEQLAYLKGFITALENSNKNFKFNPKGTWDQIKNLIIAGQFGQEEYQDNEGEVKLATKLVQFRSLDKLKEIKIPRVKLLDGSYMDYEKYKFPAKTETKVEVKAEDLPFEI